MDIRRGLLVAVTTMTLTSVVTPAWAITQSDCTGPFGGQMDQEGGEPVCRFPLVYLEDFDTCDAVTGFPREMEESYECVAPIDEPADGAPIYSTQPADSTRAEDTT